MTEYERGYRQAIEDAISLIEVKKYNAIEALAANDIRNAIRAHAPQTEQREQSDTELLDWLLEYGYYCHVEKAWGIEHFWNVWTLMPSNYRPTKEEMKQAIRAAIGQKELAK